MSAEATPDRLLRPDELRALLDAAGDAVVAMDEDGRVQEWNDAATALLGWTRGEAVGRSMAAMLVPDRLVGAHAAGVERHLRTGERRLIGRRTRLTACRRDGAEVPVRLSLSEATLAGRRTFFAVMRDLRGEAARERERADVVLAVTSDAVVTCGADGTVRSFNDAAAATFGRPAGEVLGAPIDVLGLDELPLPAVPGGAVEQVAAARHADGSTLDLVVVAVPLGDGTLPADVLLVMQDRTRLRRAEAERLEAQERFDGAFAHAPIGMVVADAAGRAVAVNDALCALLGRDDDELVGTPVAALAAVDGGVTMEEAVARLAGSSDEAAALALDLERADGRTVAAQLTATAVRDVETGRLRQVVWLVAADG